MKTNKNIKYAVASSLMILMTVAMVWLLTSAQKESNSSELSSLQDASSNAQRKDELYCQQGQRMISSVGVNKCESLFPTTGLPQGRLFSLNGLRKFQSAGGREMVYDFKPPRPGKRVMVIFHGLGDDFFYLQRIAELADKDGWGILRMDLNGHGATLDNYMAKNNHLLPHELSFQNDVDDVVGLIEHLQLKNTTLVGHSRGGGISLRVSEILPKSKVFSVHAMAPYLQRIDKFISQMMTSPDFMIASADTTAQKVGVPKPIVTILDPFILLTWQWTRRFKKAQDLSNAMFNLDKIKDAFMDPAMQPVLEKAYRKVFAEEVTRGTRDLTAEEIEMVELRVQTSILAMKGLRGLDFLDALTKLGQFPEVTQIIYGEHDPLVVPEIPKAFGLRLTQEGVPHILTAISGDKETAGHRFPQMQPEVVYEKIMAALRENNPRARRQREGR